MKIRTWQRTLQLAWLGMAAAVLGTLAARGMWWAAGLLALPLLLGHLGWLGLQFVLAARANTLYPPGEGDPPVPSRAAWWRAWWAEVLQCTRSYGWQQPWTPDAQLALLPAEGQASGRGILFVHGYFASAGFWAPWTRRLRALNRPHLCVSLDPAFADIDDYAPVVEKAFRRLYAATGVAPLVVCHSMGGLVVRAWLRWRIRQGKRAGRLAAPLDVIGIACPHHGTVAARYGVGVSAAQMRLGSPWLAELAAFEADLTGNERPNWVCLYSNADNMVYPPRTACLDGGREALLEGLGHMELVFDPRVDELLLWLLDENPGDASWGLTMPAGLDVAMTRPAPL
jgi:pimeloyl-ACP methyl ester carboxylesterase